MIVAHFYDVESGRAALSERGRGSAHEQFRIPVPRDGGIQDLLDESERPDRRFDAVICDAIDRIARNTYFGTKIEYKLEQGQYRYSLLDAHLKTIDDAQRHEREERIRMLRQAVSDTETKRKRLVRNLEQVDEPDEDLIRDVNERRAELRAHGDDLERQLEELENEVHAAPNPVLLSRLPISPIDLAALPDELSRRLFESLSLELRYDDTNNVATCCITLTGETIDAVARTSAEATVTPLERGKAIKNSKELTMKTEDDALRRHPSVWCPRQDSNLRHPL